VLTITSPKELARSCRAARRRSVNLVGGLSNDIEGSIQMAGRFRWPLRTRKSGFRPPWPPAVTTAVQRLTIALWGTATGR